MRSVFLATVVISFLALESPALAGKKGDHSPKDSHCKIDKTACFSEEQKEVHAALSSWVAAISSGNAENILSLYSDTAVLLPTLEGRPISNQEGRRVYFKKLLAKPKVAVAVSDVHLRVLDKDIAVASGLYSFSYEEGESNVVIPARFSFLYEKMHAQWKIVDHHSSRLPGSE